MIHNLKIFPQHWPLWLVESHRDTETPYESTKIRYMIIGWIDSSSGVPGAESVGLTPVIVTGTGAKVYRESRENPPLNSWITSNPEDSR